MSDLAPNVAFPIAGMEPAREPAIDPRLTPEMLERLSTDLQLDLDTARSAKNDLDDRVERYRAYYAVDSLPQQYENQPNHRVPYIRGKVNGAVAHFRAALDQDPFFVTRPYTADAQTAQGPWETMMEREIDQSGTRRQLFAAIEEALLTGTGVMQLSVAQTPKGEKIVQGKAIRFEDFLVAPIGVEDISRCSTFYRYKEPWHIIRRHFDEGYYSEEMRGRVEAAVGTHRRNYDEKVEATDNFQYQTDNAPRELYECYYRWGNEEIGYTLWRVIYHEEQNIILRCEESPYLSAFDAPPYVPIRALPRIDYFFGESYAQVLEGVQNVLDFAYNAKLAYDQFAITPTVFVNEDSEAFKLLKDKQLAPGMIVPVVGNPADSIMAMPLPQAPEALNLMQTARALGDDATFNDLLMQGIPTNKVRSATEVNAVLNTATKHLQRDLKNASVDLATFAMMYWRLIYDWKIKPLGVTQVFEGSEEYVIGVRDISESEVAARLVQFLGMQAGFQIDDTTAEAIAPVIMQQAEGPEFFVAGALRDDMEWVPNGGTLLPEKAARASKLERLMGQYVMLFAYARQFKEIWELTRMYLINMDIVNWRAILPAEPPEQNMTPEVAQQMGPVMEQMRQGGGTGG